MRRRAFLKMLGSLPLLSLLPWRSEAQPGLEHSPLTRTYTYGNTPPDGESVSVRMTLTEADFQRNQYTEELGGWLAKMWDEAIAHQLELRK